MAASHNQLRERRPPFLLTSLIVRGGHHGWSWEAATVFTYFVDRERRPPWLIVRVGHHNLIKFSKIHYTKWHKIWFTLFIHYPIKRWPPLVTTSLGQAVCWVWSKIYLISNPSLSITNIATLITKCKTPRCDLFSLPGHYCIVLINFFTYLSFSNYDL